VRVLPRTRLVTRMMSAVSNTGPTGPQLSEEGDDHPDLEAMKEDFYKTKTFANLKQLFEGECVAYVRYRLFADKADLEGFTGLADMFRSLANSELKQAEHLFRVVDDELGIDVSTGLETMSTEANLRAAVKLEEQDAKVNYPRATRIAFKEQVGWIAEMLDSLGETESRHLDVISIAYNDLLEVEKAMEEDEKRKAEQGDGDAEGEEEDEANYEDEDEEDGEEEEDHNPRRRQMNAKDPKDQFEEDEEEEEEEDAMERRKYERRAARSSRLHH